jgi:hypothetical protein
MSPSLLVMIFSGFLVDLHSYLFSLLPLGSSVQIAKVTQVHSFDKYLLQVYSWEDLGDVLHKTDIISVFMELRI